MRMIILAHGTLGDFDELIFLGIIVIFAGLMFISWFRSRGNDYDKSDLMPETSKSDETESESSERFQLD